MSHCMRTSLQATGLHFSDDMCRVLGCTDKLGGGMGWLGGVRAAVMK